MKVQFEGREIDVEFPFYGPEIEAALCCWEWMNHDDQYKTYQSLWEDYGSGGMRMTAVQAGQIVLTVYDLMEAQGYEFVGAYDFEFVPFVLAELDWPTLVDDNQYKKGGYRPDPAPILAKFMADHARDIHDVWIDKAKKAGTKLWGYTGLTDDHPELIDRTQDPEAWVKEMGEDLELTPAEVWGCH